MKNFYLFIVGSCFLTYTAYPQSGEAPNIANSATLPSFAAQVDKMMSNPVNLYTGVPNISIPLFSYQGNNGINTGISIDYAGGGIQVGEYPSIVGLGWHLNFGGAITRTVRGMPDDFPDKGFLYSPEIPNDWRNDASKYYHDSIDTQQDIFQFNFQGHSGRFYLAKDGSIAIIPSSKIKIIPSFSPVFGLNSRIESFRIITEDGIKYDFKDALFSSVNIPSGISSYPISGYFNVLHKTSWLLTRIISAFNQDTIQYNYRSENGASNYYFQAPQITFVNNVTGIRKTPGFVTGNAFGGSKLPLSILLPNKTRIDFIYSFTKKYDNDNFVLSKVKVSDTVFRYGYMFNYLDTFYSSGAPHHGGGPSTLDNPMRIELKSIIPFTAFETQQGFQFAYNTPPLPVIGNYANDTIQNQRDYWGFWNGKPNGDSSIPKINNYAWGADRSPTLYALAGSLKRFYLPTGGSILYGYELNDHFPYTIQQNNISINAQNATQINITLNQVLSNRHQLNFFLDKSISRVGAAPVSGTGILNLAIKSLNGVTTYQVGSISLYELFYTGLKRWTFNLPNGSYKLYATLANGTAVSIPFPIDVTWENKTTNTSLQYQLSGGLRVRSISRSNETSDFDGSYEEYRYILEDGKSSGYLGETPRYDYPFREVYLNGGNTTIDYTAVCSEPLGNSGFAQTGYSRVEVVRKSLYGNLGKVVHEFTDLRDVDANTLNQSFPFIPSDIKDWALGVPKRISIFDSSGILVKRTVNHIQIDTVQYAGGNFKSVKLGHYLTVFNGGTPEQPPSNKTKYFLGDEYYPIGGRIYITGTEDTIFHPNLSYNSSYQQFEYDTNYNLIKTRSSFDRNRGLELERRLYYPYNYTIGGAIGQLRDSGIISQVVSEENWILGDDNRRMISGVITGFRACNEGFVKPDTIYAFESNKPITIDSINYHNPNILNRNAKYFKPKTFFTKYDNKGNSIEIKDLVTGLSTSSILDYDKQFTIAVANNATQEDIAYTSFETNETGNWVIPSTNRNYIQNFNGHKSYELANGSISKPGLNTSKSYLVTLWAYSGASVSVNGNPLTNAIASQNKWNLYSYKFQGSATLTISGFGLIDELRLHPNNSNMQTSTYDPMVGITSSVDANNTVIYTEYDKLNRVKLLRDKDKNIIKRFDYADSSIQISLIPQWNGIEKVCSSIIPGHIDSVYVDINIYSDSAGYLKHVDQGYLDCTCPNIANDPQYKIVNGVCEMGTWEVYSSIWKKVWIDEFTQDWRWVCTYRFCFSDGSSSTFSQEVISTVHCPVTCGPDL